MQTQIKQGNKTIPRLAISKAPHERAGEDELSFPISAAVLSLLLQHLLARQSQAGCALTSCAPAHCCMARATEKTVFGAECIKKRKIKIPFDNILPLVCMGIHSQSSHAFRLFFASYILRMSSCSCFRGRWTFRSGCL